MHWKRYLHIAGLVTALMCSIGQHAFAENPWGGLYSAGGSSLFDFGLNLYSVSSSLSPYGLGGLGGYGLGGVGGLGGMSGCGCLSSYSPGLYGSNWGLGGGMGGLGAGLGLDLSLNIDIGMPGLGNMGGFGYYPYSSMYGNSLLGGLGGFGSAFPSSWDLGCSVGMCTTGSLPWFGNYGSNGVSIAMPPGVWGYSNMSPMWPSAYSPLSSSGLGIDIDINIGIASYSSPYVYAPSNVLIPQPVPTSYMPPISTIPWGGCDGIIVPCGGGPIARPVYVPPQTPYVPSTTTTYVPPVIQTHGGGTTFPTNQPPVITVGSGSPSTTTSTPQISVTPNPPIRFNVPRGTKSLR